MSLKCGIVGLPNVGKSTLFNCLSNTKAQSANYPFCTIEPNVGTINVPDIRLNMLESIVKPERVLPTSIEIVDIAGLVKGASKGEGLGNQFLANIRETNAIIHVLRCFDDENITHVEGRINPIDDKEIIDIELQLKDMESIEKRINQIKRAANAGDKDAKKQYEILDTFNTMLGEGKSLREYEAKSKEEIEFISTLQLITTKPVLYLCNVDESSIVNGNKYSDQVKVMAEKENAEFLIISAKIEADIMDLDSFDERQMFLEDLGLSEIGVNKLIRSAYHLLNLYTYFTAGVKEVRAWTIKQGSSAPKAAGEIHTDFEKGFIRAEVIAYDDYIKYNGENGARDSGKLRVEGKEYIVNDGDIMHFRFNV